MVFMPNKKEKIEICKSICDEEAKKLKFNKTRLKVNNCQCFFGCSYKL